MHHLFSQIAEIEEKLGYQFKNKELLFLAFTHRSFWNEHKEELTGHNERLEFLGDSFLGFIVADYLYQKYPDLAEGTLSDLRAQLVKAERCAQFFTQLALEPYLLLGKGEQANGGRGRQTIIADFFEALIGAIYLDGGYKAAHRFFFMHFQEKIGQNMAEPEVNWKALLQDYVQKTFQTMPVYEVLGEEGPSHNKLFSVALVVRGERIAEGRGASKKSAQVEAARNGLYYYTRGK